MGLLIALLTLALLVAVVALVSAPLRRARRAPRSPRGADGTDETAAGVETGPGSAAGPVGDARAQDPAGALDELLAAREAKYREIRDAELDYRTGKLSRADYEAIDAELRGEAIEILDRLERLTPKDA